MLLPCSPRPDASQVRRIVDVVQYYEPWPRRRTQPGHEEVGLGLVVPPASGFPARDHPPRTRVRREHGLAGRGGYPHPYPAGLPEPVEGGCGELRLPHSARPGEDDLPDRVVPQRHVDRTRQGRPLPQRGRVARRSTDDHLVGSASATVGGATRRGHRRGAVLVRRAPQPLPAGDRGPQIRGACQRLDGAHEGDHCLEVTGRRPPTQPLTEAAGVDADSAPGRQRRTARSPGQRLVRQIRHLAPKSRQRSSERRSRRLRGLRLFHLSNSRRNARIAGPVPCPRSGPVRGLPVPFARPPDLPRYHRGRSAR